MNDIFMSVTQGSWRKIKANDDDKLESPAKLGKQEIWMVSNWL